MLSNRFTLSRTFSRFAEEMLARLALGSGKRISSTSLASAMRKSSELTLRHPGRSFHTFYWGKVWRRYNATLPFRDTPCEKEGSRCYVGSTSEPLFMTHPSEVGSTSQLTLFAAMLRTALSHPICRQATTCWVWSAIQGSTGCAILTSLKHIPNRCVISFHV